MLRNLQIEWMKIKNYRVFQVFSALYLAGIILIVYIFYRVYINLVGSLQQSMTGQKGSGSDVLNLFSSDQLFQTVCFWTSFLLYFPGMIIISLFINEVNFKTNRQNIIDGWKRETFIYSKIGLIVCMSVVIAAMSFIAGFIMSQVVDVSISANAFKMIGFSFIQAFVYLMFALLLATFFRRSGVAIIVYFIYGLLLESLFMWLAAKIIPGMQHFMPLQVADSLIPFPRLRDLYLNLPAESIMLIASLAFAGLYVFLTVRKYKYDDL
ncbi:MAG: hypothetical protein HOP10_01035 [Chitinophagaceae bacterium]|nr:hypothetical protein [Chitinophagaceae bacterium]